MQEVIFVILIYIIVVFGLSRFFIPHLGFSRDSLPEKIPEDMERIIDRLKSKTNSPKEFLKLAYEYLGSKYRSERFNTALNFHYLFKSLDEIWRMKGFMPCTQSSFLLRIFLIRGGFFREEDIKRKHEFVNFILHQYLQVKIGNKWIDVDVGEKQGGMPLGKHLKYFG